MRRLVSAAMIALCAGWSADAWAEAPGKPVMGLQLALSADKDELKATPIEGAEGYTFEPTRLTLTFINTGRARLKVIAHDLDGSLVTFEVKGPDGAPVAGVRPMIARVPPEPVEKDFPRLDPSRAWSAKWQPTFPGRMGPASFKLTKPGEYRITATYACDESRLRLSEHAEDSWIGTVTSNVLVLKYAEPGKEAPRGPEAAASEPVNGLRLTLSADKGVLRMKARELLRAAEDTPRYDVEAATFTLAFANVSDKPIKLDAHALGWRLLKLSAAGPGEKSVVKKPRLKAAELAAPKEADYPTIEPGKSWTCEVRATFPCDVFDGFYALQEPGEYRFKATYDRPEEKDAPALAEDCWTGTVPSNEVVIRCAEEGVAEPGAAKAGGLRIELTSEAKEIRLKPTAGPRGTVIYQAEPVKLTVNIVNAGEKAIKFYAHGLATRLLALSVAGPDDSSVRAIKATGRVSVPPPTENDFPTLDPNSAFTLEQTIDFPGAFAGTTFSLLRPGEYRLKLTYSVSPADLKISPFAADSWTGTVSSEELVLTAVVAAGK